MTPEEACEKAVELAGGAQAVALFFGMSANAVVKWKRVPARKGRCLKLSRLIGWRVTVQHMRPDVFGSNPAELLAAAGPPPRRKLRRRKKGARAAPRRH